MKALNLRLKLSTLEKYDLPDILYPMSDEVFDMALAIDGELPLSSMLHALQNHSIAGEVEWQELESAMDRLAQLLAPDDTREVLAASGSNWWVEIGPVDLGKAVVTIQRGEHLIAAICSTDCGRLRVAAFRPLDAKSIASIISLATKPHSQFGVCMRENNWEYALDCSAGNGNFYAYERGEAYLSYWENGLGLVSDGTQDAHWLAMKHLPSRQPALVVTELGVYYSHS